MIQLKALPVTPLYIKTTMIIIYIMMTTTISIIIIIIPIIINDTTTKIFRASYKVKWKHSKNIKGWKERLSFNPKYYSLQR